MFVIVWLIILFVVVLYALSVAGVVLWLFSCFGLIWLVRVGGLVCIVLVVGGGLCGGGLRLRLFWFAW